MQASAAISKLLHHLGIGFILEAIIQRKRRKWYRLNPQPPEPAATHLTVIYRTDDEIGLKSAVWE
jgi:hypothetical protein